MIYKNFVYKEPNTLWTWVDDNGGYRFDEVAINNAIAGDTDSIMLTLQSLFPPEADQNEVVEIADGIAKLTNESFPEWVMHAFNAPEDRKHTIQTDREIVADVSLFLTKKRYVMHVVDDEGKNVDKLKLMGLEIKKSDTPKYVKEMLDKLVRGILNGFSSTTIKQMINTYKQGYADQLFHDIARPISVNGLKLYQTKYDELGTYKGFPYQVRAAMFYNSLCGPSDRRIVPGDKIGVVYIKDARSKYIAFPLDINVLPSFFDDLVIDYDTQWNKAYKKIVSYLGAMDWDFKSEKEEARKNLFGF